MEKMIETTRYIFLLVAFAILVLPLSFIMLISDIRDENELRSKY